MNNQHEQAYFNTLQFQVACTGAEAAGYFGVQGV
jgi:hypothetical protein